MPSGPRAGLQQGALGWSLMVDEVKLSAVLSEFARTLATDFPIQGILDHLVERIVEVLPVTGAGVTLISADMAPRYVAASDASALRYERLQAEIREGPCVLAYDSGDAVAVPDLRSDDRFPNFGPAATQAGLAAVFTFPLRHGNGRLGALDLYRDAPGDLDRHDMGAAQTLADVTTAYLLNAEARDEARTTHALFRHIALHDPLTRLPNRLLLDQRLQHAGLRAQRSKAGVAVLFLDLDRFKDINDRHGHHVGDELLLAVAHRLSGLVRPGDTLARISGDEFVFVCEGIHHLTDAEVLAERVVEAFDEPFVLVAPDPTVTVAMTASVGVAFADAGQDVSEQLVIDADLAMYACRRDGARHQIVDVRRSSPAGDRANLKEDLRAALERDELAVAYQPIVRSSDALVIGMEGLLRWTHPDRGPIPPLAIVALAESSELIDDVGAWVLERSCRDRGRWLHDHPNAPLDLAVNVSAGQLMRPGFHTTVEDVLSRTDMDPTALVLEVTESIFIEDGEYARTVLSDLRAMGIRLALDDFGTGFSSLSYLRRLPIDIVKIDRSFVADIGRAGAGGAILAAVTNLVHLLGLTVTAEGVETSSQRDEVSAIGCELAQGFYFSMPEPAAAIAAQLAAHAETPWHLPADRELLSAGG